MRLPEPIVRWYGNLAPREQRLALAGAGIALLLIVYLAVVQPLAAAHNRVAMQAKGQHALLVWLDQAATRLQSAAPAAGGLGHLAPGESVLAAVSSAARGASVSSAIQRIEQAGNGGARITLTGAPFDDLVRWLGTLRGDDGVVVVAGSLQQSRQPGTVDGTLTLNTGT